MVLVALIGVFIGGLKLMDGSQLRTKASNVGREVLEAIADEGGFDFVPTTDSFFDGVAPTPTRQSFPPPPYPQAEREGRTFTVSVETSTLTERTRAVLVTVTWGEEGSVQLERTFNAVE